MKLGKIVYNYLIPKVLLCGFLNARFDFNSL